MIKLTDQEKIDLKDIFERPGFKVLEKIAEDFELWVLRRFKIIDTSKKNDLSILAKNVDYLRWMEDFLKTAKIQINCVSERKSDEQLQKEKEAKEKKEQG